VASAKNHVAEACQRALAGCVRGFPFFHPGRSTTHIFRATGPPPPPPPPPPPFISPVAFARHPDHLRCECEKFRRLFAPSRIQPARTRARLSVAQHRRPSAICRWPSSLAGTRRPDEHMRGRPRAVRRRADCGAVPKVAMDSRTNHSSNRIGRGQGNRAPPR